MYNKYLQNIVQYEPMKNMQVTIIFWTKNQI